MKPARGFAQIIIVAVIALAFSAAAIFGYQKFFKKSTIFDRKTETQASPVASADVTGSWKTYNDSKYNYSFKYPSAWQMEDPNKYVPDYVSIFSPDYVPDTMGTKKGLIVDIAQGQRGEGDCPMSGAAGISDTKSVRIDNHQAYSQHVDYEGHSLTYCINRENFTLYIHFGTSGLSDEQKYQSTIDQIVSSFKFTDQTASSGSTANWKTYTNEKYELQFSYPESWVYNEETAENYFNVYFAPPPKTDNSSPVALKGVIRFSIINTGNTLEKTINNFCESEDTCASFSNAKDILVGDIAAKKIRHPGPIQTDEVLFKKGPNTFMFSVNYDKSSEEIFGISLEKKLETFNLILSTFKFTQ